MELTLKNLIVSKHGTRLSREGSMMVAEVRSKDGTKERRKFSPLEIEQVIITCEASVTSGLIRLLLEEDVDLVFVHHRPNTFARVVDQRENIITDLWKKQLTMPEEEKVSLAKAFVRAGGKNKVYLLRSLSRSYRIDLKEQMERIGTIMEELDREKSINEIFGFEGNMAERYFKAVRRILPGEIGFFGRKKNPSPDPVNAMLSYGYTVLASRVEYGLLKAGLNPYEGILHSTGRGRKSLTFDLIEEFRQPIVDRVVLTLVARKQLHGDDFIYPEEGVCHIDGEGKRLFLDSLYSRFEDTFTCEGNEKNFLDIINLQAGKLAEAVRTGGEYQGFLYRI